MCILSTLSFKTHITVIKVDTLNRQFTDLIFSVVVVSYGEGKVS